MKPLDIVFFFLPCGEVYQRNTPHIEHASAWLPDKTYLYQPLRQLWWLQRNGYGGTTRGTLSLVPSENVPSEIQTKALLLI